MRYIFLLLLCCASIYAKHDPLVPRYDVRCNAMLCERADINPYIYSSQEAYWDADVPLIVHQIWFGDKRRKPKIKTDSWKRYSDSFGYEYHLWNEDDLDQIKLFASPDNFKFLKIFLEQKNYWAASDILRYEILHEFGGVYIDCDFNPPMWEDEMVDLRVLTPFKGLTTVTENHGRNIGEHAIFVCNGFIISSPGHPHLFSLISQVHRNIEHWYHRQKNYDAMFITGPFFFNKVLTGPYNVLPISYIRKFRMCN